MEDACECDSVDSTAKGGLDVGDASGTSRRDERNANAGSDGRDEVRVKTLARTLLVDARDEHLTGA